MKCLNIIDSYFPTTVEVMEKKERKERWRRGEGKLRKRWENVKHFCILQQRSGSAGSRGSSAAGSELWTVRSSPLETEEPASPAEPEPQTDCSQLPPTRLHRGTKPKSMLAELLLSYKITSKCKLQRRVTHPEASERPQTAASLWLEILSEDAGRL